ncbi:hypothetical protein [Microbacterium sp. MM2322]|uniref:hypothetical protein n=1 Tax=Microbacterium sp. MM2322 TaxID=3157631 RepID=UPI0032D596AC
MDPVTLESPPALRELTVAEAPFPGVLRAGEPLTVWVDAADFAASPAWSAAETDHVLAPIDAAGTPEGPRVVLPHCPVRLDDVVADADVSPGALVTIAVSALRGAAEADRLGAQFGRWWVTTEGRPVLALTGSLDWRADTVGLLRGMDSGSSALRAALERAADAIDDPRRLRRDTADIENALFAAADPEPLPTERREASSAAPARARATGPYAAGHGIAGTVRDLIGRLVDVGIAERLSRCLAVFDRPAGKKRRARERTKSSRRRIVFVAAGAATAVIIVGALWPTGDADKPAAAVDAVDTASTPASEATGAVPKESASGEDEGPAEIVGAARLLVDALGDCADDACRSELWEDPAAAGKLPAAEGDYAVEVVDEYGGAAAVRIVGKDLTQVLVMVRVKERWLVREVYDLADQP